MERCLEYPEPVGSELVADEKHVAQRENDFMPVGLQAACERQQRQNVAVVFTDFPGDKDAGHALGG
jgi:hypothetical protein